MTERLEQTDSYLTTFRSVVTETREAGREVSLASSAFYPTSGGQLFDTGTLGGLRVTNVLKEAGQVWHRLEGSLELGSEVVGVIDWPRRYRHMQRHSAQHLISQAFVRLSPHFETRSVSLSSPVCTVDVAGEPDESALRAAQTLVNEQAYLSLPIRSFTVSDAEAANYPLRRPPKVSGQIRLVQMGDWEVSACGGTHLRSSAEALPIKLLGLERVKGNLRRLSFLTGWEALADYDLKHRVCGQLGRTLSAQVADLPERLNQLQRALKESRDLAAERLEPLADALAEHLLTGATNVNGLRIISQVLADPDIAPKVASRLAQQPDTVALLAYETLERANYLFTRSYNVNLDMTALLQRALPAIEGRGGGKPERAQGGGSKLKGLEEGLERARLEAERRLG